MAGEEQEKNNKGFRLPGFQDIQRIPCAREAFLHGAGGSLVAGLLHFLATSRARRSFHVGYAGFVVTTLCSWFYCRWHRAHLRVQQRMIQGGMKNKIIYEGSGLDPNHRPGPS